MKRIIKNNSIIIIISLILSIILVLGFFSLILNNSNAKYKNNTEWNHYFESNGFYISSDTLNSPTKKTIINHYNYENIEINITNSIDELNISNFNIDYELTCNTNSNYNCILDNESNEITSNIEALEECYNNETKVELTKEECNNNNYTWKLNKNNKTHILKIEKLNDDVIDEYIQVNISLKTTNPFNKILQGTYILNLNNDTDNYLSYTIEDNSTYCNILFTNAYVDNKKIKVSINTDKILFDDTDKIFLSKIDYTSNNGLIDSITIDLEGTSTNNIKVYKTNYTQNCTTNDIIYDIID